MRNPLLAPIAALALAGAASTAHAAVRILTFNDATCDGQACRDARPISNTYGDGVGVDVSYRSVALDSQITGPLIYWSTGYGDLSGVLYGGTTTINHRSEIILKALPGYEISLIGFDFATYSRLTPTTPIKIDSLGGTSIFADRLSTNPGGHAHLNVDSGYFADGIRLAWGPDGFNVGVDNVTFDVRKIAVAGVPEPGTWALMILGFGGAGAVLRRRRAPITA